MKIKSELLRSAWCASLLSALLTACSSVPSNNMSALAPISSPPAKKVVIDKSEKLSARGNKQFYTVKNKLYEVKPTYTGYRERGLASWYGKQFHRKLTSNREVFNMYKLTAAHKNLPLPSYVKVTNLQNGRNTIVRVNDRGPFRPGRIIDLSYAAAKTLDMTDSGIAPVEIEVIKVPLEQNRITQKVSYIQVAAYNSEKYAERLMKKLRAKHLNAFVSKISGKRSNVYRVRVGPLYLEQELKKAKTTLNRFGYRDYLVMN